MQDKSGCWWLTDPQYALPSGILSNGCTLGSVCRQPCPACAQECCSGVRAGWSARLALLFIMQAVAGCYFMLSLHKRAVVQTGWDLLS